MQINEGMLYENAIAQMLVENGHKLYFYSHYNEEKHRNDMEIDFIITNNSKLKYRMFPIVVKSGKQYKITSLKRFREKYKSRIGESYIIHPENLIIKDGIICIPPYMTMLHGCAIWLGGILRRFALWHLHGCLCKQPVETYPH